MIRSTQKMNPFPGLRPFTQEEDYLFFGREEQTLELLARLGSHRFVAVVGTSGSGKSSLVRCGLISELLGGKMLEAGASWEIAVTHPGGNPLGLLTEALLDADLYDRDQENTRENLLATLSRSHFGLVEAVKQAGLGEGTNFLLVVDQFEEIFRFHETGQTQQEMANEFVSILLEAVAQKEVPIYVVLTMRSDFIGECGQFEGLAEMVNQGEFLIPRLTREQYKRVIEGPIKVAGGRIAPRLLQRLLNDLGNQADQLPCLQHALMRTWNVAAEKGDQGELDLDDYQRVGRMSEALSLHADEVFAALAGDRQRELCAGVFKALTVQESENRGIRRPQRLGRLAKILDVPAGDLVPIIDAYRHQGITFLMPSPEVELSDRTIIDISHESLMRVWTRLRHWVEEEAQAAGIYLRLSESAVLYRQGKTGLYRDPELGIALAWQESQKPNAAWAERYHPDFDAAMAFLAVSREAAVAEERAREAARQRELEQARQLAEAQQLRLEHQQRATKRLRKLIAGLAVVVVIACLACVAAVIANRRANTAADNARENAKRAEQSQQETAQALTVVESQKAVVEGSLSKAEAAERTARAAEEAGRKLLYTTDMQLVPFIWKDAMATAAQLRGRLDAHDPARSQGPAGKEDVRGFEWHYYQHLLEHSAAVFSGHAGAVVDAAFTATGQLETLDENGQIRRWNLDSGDEEKSSRHDLSGGPGAQRHVVSPNGRLAALARGNKVHVFDTATGKETRAIDSANTPVRLLIFSRNDDRLVIADDKIRWLNAVSGAEIASFEQKFNRIESVALSADGLTLAVVGHGGSGSFFSIFRLDATAKKVAPLAKDIRFGGTMQASALSPDGQRLAVGAKLSGAMFVFDTANGRSLTAHEAAHASPISAMAFSGDGVKLATADAEATIKIWTDAQKLTSKSAAQRTLRGHQGAINTVGFSINGKQLATTSADKTARVWDLEDAGAAIRPLESSNESSLVARFSPDGQWIAADGDTSVRLWDAATGRLARQLSTDDKSGVFSAAFSPTDNRLLAVGHGGRGNVSFVSLWDIDIGKELGRLRGATELPDYLWDANTGVVGALAFSPDGKYLVAGFGVKTSYGPAGDPNPLLVWDVATRRLSHRLNGHTGFCLSLDFSKDGTLLASGSRDGTAIIWSTDTWKAKHTFQNPDKESLYGRSGHHGMVEGVAFSPDGKTLAMASREGNVHLWDVATGKLLATLKGHSSEVMAVAFAPDGRTLASGSGDQTVRLWNVETRRELLQLGSGSIDLGGVRDLAFSPDGKHLVAGGNRSAVWSAEPIVWNDPDRAAAKLRLLLKSNADFQNRLRILSENLRLHEALTKLDSKEARVQAALAATRANWHASRQAWPEATLAFDRLVAADPTNPGAWLRTPGLLRLATALLYQDRPADAALLLQEVAKRQTHDPAISRITGFGFRYEFEDGTIRLIGVFPDSPAFRAKLLLGDVIVKVNGVEMTTENISNFQQMLVGDVGTKLRLTVRQPGSAPPRDVELVKESFRLEDATGKLFMRLLGAVEKRLTKDPKDVGLLELRAELAAQDADVTRQVADYTTAIKILAEQSAEALSARLRRLYQRRGEAYVGLRQWQKAVDDYARVVTSATTDEALLSNQALALAESLLAESVDIIVPTSEKEGTKWRFITEKPATEWMQPSFDDSHWKDGVGPFGTGDLQRSRTEWSTPDIWLRRSFECAHAKDVGSLFVRVNADDIAQVFLNGKPVCRQGTFTKQEFVFHEVERQVGTLLVPGMNTLAVHCQNTGGPGHIDVGLYAAAEGSRALWKRLLDLAANQSSDPWIRLATAYQIRGNQQAIDQLVERHPKLAGRLGDLFIQDENKDWQRALSLYSKGIAKQTVDVDLLGKRARGYEGVKNWDAAAADWSRAATGNTDGAKLLHEFARRLAASGQGPLAKDQFEKSKALYDRLLEASPESYGVTAELAQLLLDKHANDNPTRWTILKPTEMKSAGGATLTQRDDGSILAGGKNPERDDYFLVAKTDLKQINAIRLEALPDPSLPHSGPGRFPGNGNFHLNKLRVFSSGKPCDLTGIFVTYDQGQEFSKIIAGKIDANAGWSIAPNPGQANTAIIATRLQRNPNDDLKVEMYFSRRQGDPQHNLGRFRLSVSEEPTTFEVERTRFAALKLSDPWAKLAAAYHFLGDQPAIDKLLKRRPAAAAGIADVYANAQDWERAIAEYRKLVTDQPADGAMLTKLAAAYESAGRTSAGLPYLAKASAADPQSTMLSKKLASLQAWFGLDKEFAATRQRILAFAKDKSEATTAERAAIACSTLPSTDKAELEAALNLGHTAVKIGKGALVEWNLVALGMAEHRSGNHAAAKESLLAAEKIGPTNPDATGIAAFYRAMSLFRQGKTEEARALATAATAKMKPLPKDDNNPLAGIAGQDELILWLAYKEAKALIRFDAAPPPQAQEDKK